LTQVSMILGSSGCSLQGMILYDDEHASTGAEAQRIRVE
jgi:metal-sulfur cluster biosynthetic enzyme